MIDMRTKLPPFRFRVALAVLTIISFVLLGLFPSHVPGQSPFAGGFEGAPSRGPYLFEAPGVKSAEPETESRGSVHGSLLGDTELAFLRPDLFRLFGRIEVLAFLPNVEQRKGSIPFIGQKTAPLQIAQGCGTHS